MEKFKFDCGCEFDIIGPAKHKFTIPRLKIDLYNLREDCPKTWELVKSGKTQGVFQVESQLGQTWSKKVSPDNIDELGAIGALVRPGCLKSISEGKSLTEHYADRRNGREAVKSFHPVVDECLKNTYNVMVYQEDAIRLASTIAGFTLEEADQLRKAIGKKIASEMSKLKTLFLEKALALGIVSKEQAEEVFDWIEKSQRYSFNKSHSAGYAKIGYQTAYAKCHSPIMFYCNCLRDSIEQADGEDDVKKLVADAQSFGYKVNVPNILSLQENFYTDGEQLFFGLVNIKNVGKAVIKKLLPLVETLPKPLSKLNWVEFLIYVASKTNSKAVSSMAMSGALDYLKIPRGQMLYEYDKFSSLKDSEIEWIRVSAANKTLEEAIYSYYKAKEKQVTEAAALKKKPIGVNDSKRLEVLRGLIKMLKEPSYDLKDRPVRIIAAERELLGVALTYTVQDSIDSVDTNCTCDEFVNGKSLEKFVLGVEIGNVRPYNIKNGQQKGKNMYFVDISDGTANVPATVFPKEFEQFGSLITPGNKVILFGVRDAKKGGFTVNKAVQA